MRKPSLKPVLTPPITLPKELAMVVVINVSRIRPKHRVRDSFWRDQRNSGTRTKKREIRRENVKTGREERARERYRVFFYEAYVYIGQ